MNNIETILGKERNGFETKVETHERLYGKNSCFLVGESYRSLYYDDYCGFKYYSNVTGEYFEDSWSTAYACPPYSCFEVEIKFDKAKELGLIDIEKFNKNWEHTVHEIGSFYENNPMEWATFFKRFPHVEVYRGRSFKGRKGLLIAQKKICQKGYPSLMAVVFDTKENEFFMVKLQYVKLTSDFISSVKEATNKRIEEEYKVEDRLRHFALEEEKEVIDKLFFDGNWKEFSENIYNLYSKFLMKYEAEEEKKKYAPTEKLIQWVRDHFKDVKDEEEIYKIAFNISKKISLLKIMDKVENRVQDLRNCSKDELEEMLKNNKDSQKRVNDVIDSLVIVRDRLGDNCFDETIHDLDHLYYTLCNKYVNYQINIVAIEKCLHS